MGVRDCCAGVFDGFPKSSVGKATEAVSICLFPALGSFILVNVLEPLLLGLFFFVGVVCWRYGWRLFWRVPLRFFSYYLFLDRLGAEFVDVVGLVLAVAV